jgi:hypothetical protein
MHYDSGTGFGSGLLRNNVAFDKGKILYHFLLLEKCAKYCLDPEPESKSEPEPHQINAVPQHCFTSAICHNRIVNIATQ